MSADLGPGAFRATAAVSGTCEFDFGNSDMESELVAEGEISSEKDKITCKVTRSR